MPRQNKISQTLLPADQLLILDQLKKVKDALPFLLNLSTDDRKKLRKMGPKSVEYVKACLAGAQTFPNALARDFDEKEFAKDVALVDSLYPIYVLAQSIAEGLSDTWMAAGSDAMKAADESYDSLKKAAKEDANAKALVEDISKRFQGQGKKKKTTP